MAVIKNGFEIHEWPATVLMHSYDRSRKWREPRGLSDKRSLVWHNTSRNEFVAAVARLLSDDLNRGIESLGHPRRLVPRIANPIIAGIVEECEHADELLRLLPRAWGAADHTGIWSRTTRNADSDPHEPPRQWEILTLGHVRRFGINADVVIRATGGTGLLDGFPFLENIKRQWCRPVLLVDIADCWRGNPTPDTRQRIREYEREDRQVLWTQPSASQEPIPLPSPAGLTGPVKVAVGAGDAPSSGPMASHGPQGPEACPRPRLTSGRR